MWKADNFCFKCSRQSLDVSGLRRRTIQTHRLIIRNSNS